ncbi:hypothetical protein BCV71DRAFT_245934 [Rhizopus microsporus]|nr:hypothetical protein BCV71DRAFT_245934 [Rhizopus microsporus]
MEPLDFCNKVSDSFKKLCEAANIQYTSFQRTTSKDHATAVNELWNTLLKNGYIYKGKHEGWYAVSDEAFYASAQVEEVTDEKTGEKIMVSKESGQRVEWTSEENYKFKLSAFEKDLLKWIDDNPKAIVPQNRKNEVLSWIRAGLADLSVSRLRARLNWGIQVPNDPEHTIYVWLDALTNYLTATGYPWKKDTALKDAFPPDVQVVGKDIVRFHAIFWPAFLMAAGLPLPKQILVHGHWTMNKQKMSKSRGNVADPFEVIDRYGVDPVRFYLIHNGGMADDADYSEAMIAQLYSKELAGQFGNLLSRATGKALLPSRIIPTRKDIDIGDETLHHMLLEVADKYHEAFEERQFGRALSLIVDLLSQANKYFTRAEPWNLAKKPEEKDKLDTVLWYSLETCRIAGILLQPVMPTKMNELLTGLGVSPEERYFKDAKKLVEKERPLGEMSGVLFPRIKTSIKEN